MLAVCFGFISTFYNQWFHIADMHFTLKMCRLVIYMSPQISGNKCIFIEIWLVFSQDFSLVLIYFSKFAAIVSWYNETALVIINTFILCISILHESECISTEGICVAIRMIVFSAIHIVWWNQSHFENWRKPIHQQHTSLAAMECILESYLAKA